MLAFAQLSGHYHRWCLLIMDLATRLSLLERLKRSSANPDWQAFYDKYCAVIVSFARKQGLDDHSADDVLQETVMVVMRKLPAFEYVPQQSCFRSWLLTIVAYKVRESRRRSHMDRLISMDAESGEGGEPLHERFASEEPDASENVEQAWRTSLIEEALQQVLGDPRTKPETIEVFRACALEGRPVAEVAARFGIKDNAVYQIKNRMMARLNEIIASMEKAQGSPDGATNHEKAKVPS